MKKFTCILLSLLIFATPILAQELENPCEDTTYLELKNKTLSEMTDREYEYFMQKDTACEQWKHTEREKQRPKMSAFQTAVWGLVALIFVIKVFGSDN